MTWEMGPPSTKSLPAADNRFCLEGLTKRFHRLLPLVTASICITRLLEGLSHHLRVFIDVRLQYREYELLEGNSIRVTSRAHVVRLGRLHALHLTQCPCQIIIRIRHGRFNLQQRVQRTLCL